MAPKALHILHTLGAARAGGAELFFVRLMVALHASKEVKVLPVVRHGSWAADRLKEAGVPYVTAMFGGWWDIVTRWKLKKLAQGFEADVIQSWMNRATMFTPKGPWVCVARLGGYYKLKYYFKNTDYLVGNTKNICEYCVKEGWPEGRVNWLGNFVPQVEKPEAGVRENVRTVAGIPQDAKVVMMAARLHEVKGWDVLLDALVKLEDVWLVAVGDGPEKEALQAKAVELDVAERIVWAGWQDDIAPFAAASDAWVVASRHEPLGNSVLDAWVHGVPLVATRSQGPAKLVTDGENGLLVEIDDADRLARALERVLGDRVLATALVAGGTEEIAAHHAEEVVVAKYVAYYREIVAKGKEQRENKA